MIDAAPQLRAALQTRGFDAALLAGLSVQALILLAFSLFPYTFAPKEALLLALRSSGWLTTLRRLWVYPLFAAAAAASALTELPSARLLPTPAVPAAPGSGAPPPAADRFHRALAALLLTPFTSRVLHRIENGDLADLIAFDQSVAEAELLRFTPPPLLLLQSVTRFYRGFFSPVFLGRENLTVGRGKPRRPTLFVSNHTILGFDFPLLLSWLYEHEGVFLRALADHSHFQIPVNGHVLRNMLGAVDGTRRNVDLLLGKGESVFVYPGGARETFKRTTDEKYQLFWEGKFGFASVAIQHGVDIVPVVNLGTEDMVSVVADLPLGWLPIPFLFGSDRTFPLIKPESLERIYFYFGKPISTARFEGVADEDACQEVHALTRAAVEGGLGLLKGVQERDKSRYAGARVGRGLSAMRHAILSAARKRPGKL
jgi:1-acyl-sn-glycerol-3-phosphate acyltransferase